MNCDNCCLKENGDCIMQDFNFAVCPVNNMTRKEMGK